MTALPAAVRQIPTLLVGSLDRLKGVSQHAKKVAEGGPEHLWVGVGIAVVLAGVIGLATWWTLGKGK